MHTADICRFGIKLANAGLIGLQSSIFLFCNKVFSMCFVMFDCAIFFMYLTNKFNSIRTCIYTYKF